VQFSILASHEYDGQNRLTADIRTHGGLEISTGYGYDPAGNRTSSIDPRGHTTEMKYDEWNRLWKVISPADPVRYETVTELDGEGNKVRTIDANTSNPGIRRWLRDPRGLVTNTFDAEENETRYGYDPNNNNTGITYANNSITSIAYNAEDRKGLVTEAQGQPEERSSGVVLYDKVGNPLQVKDGNGRIHATVYNALNLPWKAYDPAPFDAQFVETAYFKTGKVRSVTNRRGKTTTTDYDKLWRVTTITDPLLQTIVTNYDNVGNVTGVKDKRGKLSETVYDDLHRPVEKKRANLTLFTYEYDDNGNLKAETDAEHKRTAYSYTPRNLKETATFADTTFKSFAYDPNGNLQTETDEELYVTTYGYDRENRLTSTERAGELTQKLYTPMGSLAAEIRPKGNSRGYYYDKLNRLTSVIDDEFGIGLVTRYEYDKNNNRTKTFDARSNETEQTYDQLNRLTSRIQRKAAGDLVTSFDLYDPEGNLIDATDPKGQKQHHTYDDLNRRTQSDYTDTAGSTITVTTGYDENNNVTSSSTPADSTTNTYDDFDRLQTSTQRGTTVAYEYFDNGNRKSVTVNGDTTFYTYDDKNRVETATANNKTSTFTYYDDGKKKSVSYPNGATEEYDYHPTNRVKTITNRLGGSLISKFEYLYDQNGNRESQIETRGVRSITTGYHYDTLDRMDSYSVTENSATTTTGYTFDGYNRATETITRPDGASTNRSYGYDETDWLTLITDGTKQITYGYDNNGNTITKTDSTDPGNPLGYSYDARDKLTRATKGATLLGQYAYNAQGYRVRQQNSDRGDVEYYYDGTAVIEERNASGLLAHYRYADKLYSLTSGTGSQYYHLDALGSTSDLTDDTGSTKASYFLNPWGLILETLGDSVNRRVFTGKEIDQNTGLVYFGARYYDPDTARFTTQDSYLGEQTTPPSLHQYLYAYSNPTVYIDLEGYSVWDVFNDISSGVSKAIAGGYEGSKRAVRLGYNAGKDATVQAVKAIPKINREVAQLPEKIANSYTPTSTTGQVLATGAYTLGKAAFSGLTLPLELASETVTFAQDRKRENIPVFGPVGTAIGQTTAEFAENPTIESGARMVGAYSGGALLAAGGAEVASAMRGAFSSEAATLTTETRSARVSILEEPLEKGPAGKVGGADFYGTHSGQIIPGRFNRYWGRNPSTLAEAKAGELKGRPDGTYVSFDVIDDGIVGGDKLQVPNGRIGRTGRIEYRVTGDSLDVIDRLVVPNGKWNTSSYPEPLTTDFKEFGPGKSTQAIITGEKPIPVDPSTLTKMR